MNKLCPPFPFLLLLSILPAVQPSCANPSFSVGFQLELFVDNHLVDSLSGDAQRELVLPEAREVVFIADRPWEGNTSGYYTFFQDGDLYRMVYRGWQHEGRRKPAHEAVTCLAESRDGIHWERPELGIHGWEGSKKNNIIWKGYEAHNFTAFLDRNPSAPFNARYKAVGGHRKNIGLRAFASPDCQNWKSIQPQPILTNGAFDSQNLAFWDPHRKEYRAYWRYFGKGVRLIRTATSRDFINWENEADLSYPEGTPNEHLYTNAIQKYFRAPHLFLGFPTRYDRRSEQVEPIFMSSRDGQHFHRWNDPVIPRHAPKDRNHNRSNYMAWGMFPTPGKESEISVYATENYYEKTPGRVRRFAYRTDGFVALRGGSQGGSLLTKPLEVPSDKLVLNYKTQKDGHLKVSILDKDGQHLATSANLRGDFIDGPVKWGKMPKLDDQPIRLKFTLHNADLYSFRFNN